MIREFFVIIQCDRGDCSFMFVHFVPRIVKVCFYVLSFVVQASPCGLVHWNYVFHSHVSCYLRESGNAVFVEIAAYYEDLGCFLFVALCFHIFKLLQNFPSKLLCCFWWEVYVYAGNHDIFEEISCHHNGIIKHLFLLGYH